MRLRYLAATAACLLCGMAEASPRPFTVADSIELSSFVPPAIKYYQTTPRVLASPDGARYLAVTLRGDLVSGRRVGRLLVFEGADIRAALETEAPATPPRVVATWASASNVDPLTAWRWSSDGRQALFLGADDGGVRALFRVDLDSGVQTRLTPQSQDVAAFDENDGRIVYIAQVPMPENELDRGSGPDLPDAVHGLGKNVLEMIFPHALSAMLQDAPGELWSIEGGGAPRAVVDPGTGQAVRLQQARLKLSPGGDKVLTTIFARHVPQSWARYRPRRLSPGLDFVPDRPGVEQQPSLYRPRQYAVVDVASGAMRLLADTPIEMDVQFRDVWAAWSADGRSVAVAGLYPALPATGDERILPCDASVLRLDGGEAACVRPATSAESGEGFIARRAVSALAFAGADLRIDLTAADAPDRVQRLRYHSVRGHWKASEMSAPSQDLVVDVVEDFRRPPRVVAKSGDKVREIFDPNPQLADIEMAEVVEYRWRTPDGVTWTGALIKPPGLAPGTKTALVVQTHNLDRTRYLADGPSAAGFAARALAARGILVLQVDEPGTGSGTPEESPAGAAGYRAAIAQLAAEGLIDPKRVGITAWSHMGPYTMQGLVEDPSQYAAAIFADAAYSSYQEYLMNIDYLGPNREAMSRAEVGPKPFGPGLETWVKNSAGFRTDQVCAPTFWQIYGTLSLIYGWSSYAALRAQDKPVDLLYFRTGAHWLLKPQQRLLGQEMSVDWYDYWLNRRKDPAPAKAAQYVRWDLLKQGDACRTPAS